jgi:hypothetical protein
MSYITNPPITLSEVRERLTNLEVAHCALDKISSGPAATSGFKKIVFTAIATFSAEKEFLLRMLHVNEPPSLDEVQGRLSQLDAVMYDLDTISRGPTATDESSKIIWWTFVMILDEEKFLWRILYPVSYKAD